MSAGAGEPRVGESYAGLFDVLDVLGVGTFATVYRARQQSTGQLVALKVLGTGAFDHPGVRHIDRFRRELAMVARLEHPHIVRLIDAGVIDDRPWAAFAYVPGRTLKAVLDAETCLGWDETLHLMSQVLDALECAHALGIVHRDIKPENLLITESGLRRSAMVLDFGLAGMLDPDARTFGARLTATQEMLGTPSYAAPEQLRGEPPTPRSDLYAWALVLLECLTGRVAVTGNSTQQVLLRQLGEQAIPIPAAIRDIRLRQVLATLLHKRADARDVTPKAVMTALLEARPDQRRIAPPVHTPDEDPTLIPRRVAVLALDVAIGAEGRLDGLDAGDDYVLLDAAFSWVAEAIGRRGGHVVARLGTTAIACFGWRATREDDTRRAAHAALDLRDGFPERVAQWTQERGGTVELRTALDATILLVPRDENDDRQHVIGRGVAGVIALLRLASPGEIMVGSEAVQGLRRAWHLDAVPATSPPVHRLLGSDAAALARGSIATAEATRLVGRQAQLDRLLGAWRDAASGSGSAVVVVGEPGIGKSRLLREARRRIPHEAWIEWRCVEEAQDAPLRPVIDWLSSLDSTTSAMLERAGLPPEPHGPLLDAMLGRPTDAVLPMTRERQKDATLETLMALLGGVARTQPVVVAIEDLHWADATTLEFVGRVRAAFEATTDGVRGALLMSMRPEVPIPPELAGVATVALPPLTPDEVTAMAEAAIGEAIAPEVLDALVRGADGIPLFVEEVTRVLSDQEGRSAAGVGADGYTPVPSSLWDLLASRLDGLSTSARETAQLAAVLGREFGNEMLRAVSPRDTATLREDIQELLRSGLVFRRRSARDERFAFKHALVRDAAYESSLRRERQRVHLRVARTLQGRFPELERTRPDVLAWHFEQGGDPLAAIDYRRRAGDFAMRRGMYVEAIGQYERGLATVPHVVDEPARHTAELGLTESLGTALFTTRGYAAPEVAATFGRAQQLCDTLAAEPPLRVLYGLWGVRLARSEPEATRDLLPRLHAVAERAGDPAATMVAASCAGTRAFLAAEFRDARDAMRRCLEHRRQADYQAFVRDYGYDLSAYAYGYLAGSHWALGEPDAAREVALAGVSEAERAANPYTLTVALAFAADMGHKLRDVAMADQASARGAAIATEQKLLFWLGPLLSARGWVTAQGGQLDDGIAFIRQGLGVFAMAGVRATYRCYLAYLVECLLARGHLDEGLAAVDGNLDPERPMFDVFCDSEMLRLKALLLHAQGDTAGAESTFAEGLALAEAWGAPGLALRIATDWARVQIDRADRRRVGAIVRSIDARMSPGAASYADVVDAQAVLREMA